MIYDVYKKREENFTNIEILSLCKGSSVYDYLIFNNVY